MAATDNELTPLSAIIERLQQASSKQWSGLCYLVCDNNHAGYFSFRQGRIIYVYYRRLKGEECLRAMRQLNSGKLRFDAEAADQKSMSLPANAEIFDYLLGKSDLPGSSTAATTQTAGTTSVKLVVSPDAVAKIKQLMIEHIGPMADIFVDNAITKAKKMDDVINLLMTTLPDHSVEAKLREDIMHVLGEQ